MAYHKQRTELQPQGASNSLETNGAFHLFGWLNLSSGLLAVDRVVYKLRFELSAIFNYV